VLSSATTASSASSSQQQFSPSTPHFPSPAQWQNQQPPSVQLPPMFSAEARGWFTRGSSAYGHALLSLITDRQPATVLEKVRTGAGGDAKRTIAKLLQPNSSNNNAANEPSSCGSPTTTTAAASAAMDSNNTSDTNFPTAAVDDASPPDATQQQVAAAATATATTTTSGGGGGGAGGGVVSLLTRDKERWAFASCDGDRVAGIVDNVALDAEEAAETGRRALRIFGLAGAAGINL
jgi:hypothetical protein